MCAFVEGDRLEMGVCVWRGIGWRGVCVCVCVCVWRGDRLEVSVCVWRWDKG